MAYVPLKHSPSLVREARVQLQASRFYIPQFGVPFLKTLVVLIFRPENNVKWARVTHFKQQSQNY